MATILECSELTKKYGSHRAVDNLNLQIERGRVYALLGPNGSGKSTFMKMAAGLIHPSSGKILFEGQKQHGEIERQILVAKSGDAVETFRAAPSEMVSLISLFGA